MSESTSEPDRPHRRRPRYRGTHPRRFAEKYKELDVERFPEIVDAVRARGMTPAGQHVPILVEEVLSILAPRPGERAIDATLGFGGHARRILERLRPGGALLGLDVDPIELPRTEARLREAGYGADELLVSRTNFAGLRAAMFGAGWSDGADLLFADLGLSSMQIDDPARGFTFKDDGPLDMRMNPSRGVPAREWLQRASMEDLSRALSENADEPHALAIARSLCAVAREVRTTLELSNAVRAALGPKCDDETAEASVRRVFQAVRIEVNDEFGALEQLLRQIPECTRRGARVAILAFHSGEDRRVKRAFRAGFDAGVFAAISEEVVRPSAAERRANPRSAPAKLRWARRA